MKRSLIFIALLLIISQTALGEYKQGPVTIYDGHEADAVSVIVSFDDALPLDQILDVKLPVDMHMESLSTVSGVNLAPEMYRGLKLHAGADFSHAIIQFPPEVALKDALSALAELPEIKTVFPNYIHHISMSVNDPAFSGSQGNFRQIYVPDAWDLSDGFGAVVAVIDTGYRTSGMEDSARRLLAGYDFWGGDSNPNDYIGHGTHVANVVAERTNNGIGVAGIAYEASILPCKVFPDYESGAYEGDIIDAINWAVDQGADVINMSLGGGGYVSQTENAIANAVDNDCIVFAASGNDGSNGVDYPAAYDDCVAVGSTDQHSVGSTPVRSSFSNYGSRLDITAPGADIVQETFSGSQQGYYRAWGTSSASPHAAAVAALLVSKGGADAPAIREAIESTCYNPTGSRTDALGFGEINAYQALMAYNGGNGGNNDVPVAYAEAYPANGPSPLAVEFSGENSYDSDGTIEKFRWTTQSGEILSNSETFSHTFNANGSYTITLKVTDDEGASATDTVKISVGNNQDSCYLMIGTVYDGCGFEIIGSDELPMDYDESLDSCRDGDYQDVWECLIQCYELSEDCGEFEDCSWEKCEVELESTKGDGGNDDSLNCGICG